MDGSRFDAWTRRRFGIATGGVLASLLGGLAVEDAEAKKHHKHKKHHKRKKRCLKLRASCTPGGKHKCCGDLKCRVDSVDEGVHTVCCKTEGKHCDDTAECCSGLGCLIETSECTLLVQSDRKLHANYGSVDPADMLQRVRDLPISTWNYTSDDPTVRHIGPMAQDFAAAFNVGADDRHIHPIDGQGIALAAIQGLIFELERLRVENAALAARVARLEPGGYA
jgi:hypothetical protein